MTRRLTLLFIALLVFSCQNSDKQTDIPPTITKDSIAQDTSTPEFWIDTQNLKDTSISVDTNVAIEYAIHHKFLFDSLSRIYTKDTFEFFDKTTEGGIAVVTHNGGYPVILINGTVFGEMGKTGFEFYLLRKEMKIICAIFTDISYDRNVHEKGMKIKSKEIRFQIFQNGFLVALLNDKRDKVNIASQSLRQLDKEAKDFFNTYVGQIKIVK